jgi:dolichyl-phosphate-mannose--protein O-mannosyl transferase
VSPTNFFSKSLWTWRNIPSNLIGSILVFAFASIARIGWISSPQGLIFDEAYYQREAYTLLVAGYELQWPADGDPQVLLVDQPAFSSHPPFGKWVIAFFMNLAGDAPGAFRIGSVVCGIALVVATMIAVFLLTERLVWANLAGLLLAIDGLAIATSRIAMLDGIMTTFLVIGFVFILLHMRSRKLGAPFGVLRSWLLPAGLFLGLAVATKWSALAFLLAFLVICIAFEFGLNSKSESHSKMHVPILRMIVLVSQLLVPAAAAYVTSWAGWFAGTFSYGSYLDDHSSTQMPQFLAWLPLEWHPFILHHIDMATRVGSISSNHNALSEAWQWPLMLKPTLFAYEEVSAGSPGCIFEGGCVVSWSTVSNPFVWYPAVFAAVVLVWIVARQKSVLALAIIAGIFAGFGPWLFIQRDQYFFYSIGVLPFLVMSLVFVLNRALEFSANPQRAKLARGVIFGYSMVAVLCGLFFLPLSLHTPMPTWFWDMHIWLPGWGSEAFQPPVS